MVKHLAYIIFQNSSARFAGQTQNLLMYLRADYKKFTGTWLLIIGGYIAQAQDSTYSIAKPVSITISALYDFPESYGAAAAISYPLRSITRKYVVTNRQKRSRQRDYYISAAIGAYRYQYNYTGVFFRPCMILYRTRTSFYFTEASAGIGVLRTFYDGIVYTIDNNGVIKEKAGFGRWYATAGFSYAFGWQYKKNNNLGFLLKPMLWLQYPYNSVPKPHLMIEAGIRFKLNEVSTLVAVKVKQNRK